MKATALRLAVAGLLAGAVGSARADISANFNLLMWNDGQATNDLPSAVGVKPSSGQAASSDWLVFTADDVAAGAGFNPAGALSHNVAQFSGTSGPQFNNAPSLTGSLTLSFAPRGGSAWTVTPQAQAYTGVATPVMQMNQYMVGPGDPATANSAFGVDGVVTPGAWQADQAGNWALNYALDFYFATNADGDPSPADVDATFSNAPQSGYLIPVEQLTATNLAAVNLTAPSGFFAGSFTDYVLDEITPRLPSDATYLLITQMDKIHPAYAEAGLPITTNSLVGNTTIAYTTQAIPEPASLALVAAGGAWLMLGRRRASQPMQDETA